ncbi:MAG: hypothetical protein BSOLF_0648 [Candidatus Carbobacillus altaicus]|uniref:Uncharacterized protein n=1 Tax=Candidatus Carbonibacillus altaicus TaxID=2163959 RepID=A0A2R6Y532_9BACL|nr:MAG: hypothetical protein BSOLF_0648 [Candidatus Carbobacillus altaicus]
MLEKVNHAALAFYAKAQAKAYSAVERLKERAKEDRGAEAIEWIAMLLVIGFVVTVIFQWMQDSGQKETKGFLDNVVDVLSHIAGFLLKKG